ncbi:hypothetical protein MRB53_010744 [Persea americana]|uniref:Uncharacterized protein n=1 Tax=Persea americana TaxID=3435 RepID=A0ACC2LSQ7_PERAE|nr:hypothetical protein MRB53_010744 [Persea americana]
MISFVVFLQFVKNIHDMTVKLSKRYGRVAVNDMMSLITLEKNGKALDFFPGEVSTDRITAIQCESWVHDRECGLVSKTADGMVDELPQDFTSRKTNLQLGILQEAYWSLASALSESDGVDYTDPEKV